MNSEEGEHMAEHHATVVINAPVSQVYCLFTHFEEFPRFMRFVKAVRRLDDGRSHWVVNVVGHHEWDALTTEAEPDRVIAWRSTDGLENAGRVVFAPEEDGHTRVEVTITYNPPAGLLGDVVESLGAGRRFERDLRQDLVNFARMVDEAPPGALDPASSAYLFHSGSAVRREEHTRPEPPGTEVAPS
jgi:uncharacterized membrane protein